jgi:hypothetical protein
MSAQNIFSKAVAMHTLALLLKEGYVAHKNLSIFLKI